MNTLLIFIASFFALIWSANHLVSGASNLAAHYKVPPLLVGLTIVAIGTSAPEIFFSISSALQSKDELTIGNAIGSNIANIGLILGITLFLKPNALDHYKLKKTIPVLLIIMLFAYSLMVDGYLGRVDGCLFLIGCLASISYFIYMVNHIKNKDIFISQFKAVSRSNRTVVANFVSIGLGLILLPISSKFLVLTAATFAKWSGLSELTVGLTIISIGTSLPELATALIAVFKDEEALAVGTILGSNIYNLLLILAFPSLISPNKISTVVLWRDMPVLIAITLLLLIINYYYKKKSSWHGGVLLLVYFSYLASLIVKSSS
jgi:cation:H+ antiporter